MEHSSPLSRLAEWLSSTNKPFVAIIETASCKQWLSDPEKRWFVLDGEKMMDWESAFCIIRNVFQLPNYCGDNLNALSECLSDSDVLQGSAFVLQLRNASRALSTANPDAMQGLIETLEQVAQEWATPVCENNAWDRAPVPFHVILSDTNGDLRFVSYPQFI